MMLMAANDFARGLERAPRLVSCDVLRVEITRDDAARLARGR
jgi:hypothetical protein